MSADLLMGRRGSAVFLSLWITLSTSLILLIRGLIFLALSASIKQMIFSSDLVETRLRQNYPAVLQVMILLLMLLWTLTLSMTLHLQSSTSDSTLPGMILLNLTKPHKYS